jgi:hypothetical protein
MKASPLITVVETTSYLSKAKACMTDRERTDVVTVIATNPLVGDLIEGGGGIRKVRFAVGSRGKSGGVRVVYYYHDDRMPTFLLTVFAKNEKANLSKAERNEMAKLTKAIAKAFGR